MSREAWGDPPSPDPQFCPMCGESHHTPGCEVCELDKRRIAAESALSTLRQHIEATAAELANERSRGIHTCGPDCTRSGCVNARLREELEALRKDAARYRKLRNGKARTTGSPRAGRIEVFRWDDRMAGTQLKGEELDDAIDADLNQGGAG